MPFTEIPMLLFYYILFLWSKHNKIILYIFFLKYSKVFSDMVSLYLVIIQCVFLKNKGILLHHHNIVIGIKINIDIVLLSNLIWFKFLQLYSRYFLVLLFYTEMYCHEILIKLIKLWVGETFVLVGFSFFSAKLPMWWLSRQSIIKK